MAAGEVFAIMEIPSDYSRKLATGEQATVPMYFDMSLLLRYRALLSAITDLQMKLAHDVTAMRVETIGASSIGMASLPVESESNFLGDTSDGFASFVIPGIVILILQQSMVLGVMLLEGTSRERRRRNGGIDPKMVKGASTTALIIGKALCYTVIYMPMAMYVMVLIPHLFNLPHIEHQHLKIHLLVIAPEGADEPAHDIRQHSAPYPVLEMEQGIFIVAGLHVCHGGIQLLSEMGGRQCAGRRLKALRHPGLWRAPAGC